MLNQNSKYWPFTYKFPEFDIRGLLRMNKEIKKVNRNDQIYWTLLQTTLNTNIRLIR